MSVDILRVPRKTFAGILRAWRDGYVEPLADATKRDRADIRADFDAVIDAIATPPGYAVWHVPVVSARHAGMRCKSGAATPGIRAGRPRRAG